MRLYGFLTFGLLFLLLSISAYGQDASPSTSVPSPAPPVLNYRYLNPAFVLSSSDVDRAIAKGQYLAKKGTAVQDVLKDNTQQPYGVRGEKGRSHDSLVTCVNLNGGAYVFPAYQAAINYVAAPKPRPQGAYEINVAFFVVLKSVPKVKSSLFGSSRSANEADVTVTKFVLTDDKGNVIVPEMSDLISGIQSGTQTFSGTKHIYHTDSDAVNLNTETTTHNTGTWPTNTSGSINGTISQHWIERIPWSESHPYYSAIYTVQFPLFGSDGQPLIRADTKSITLHIITPNGEKAVTYELRPPKI